MKQLIFKKIYLELITKGQKTQTIRLWKRNYNYAPGEIVRATDFHQSILIKIRSIQRKKCSKLTLKDAKIDGFTNLTALKAAIFDIYETLDFEATLIQFELLRNEQK